MRHIERQTPVAMSELRPRFALASFVPSFQNPVGNEDRNRCKGKNVNRSAAMEYEQAQPVQEQQRNE